MLCLNIKTNSFYLRDGMIDKDKAIDDEYRVNAVEAVEESVSDVL